MDQGNSDENDAADERNHDGSQNQLSLPAERNTSAGQETSQAQSFTSEDAGSNVNKSAILTPQMIQDQRIKAMEHEMREMARQQREKQQQLRQVADSSSVSHNVNAVAASVAADGNASHENHNDSQVYPHQMEKYWDKQFGRDSKNTVQSNASNFESLSSGLTYLDNIRDTSPEENGPASKKKGGYSSNVVSVTPGAHAQVGPGGGASHHRHAAELDQENHPVETTTSDLVQANKIEDAQTIVDATDVRRDNFKRLLIVGTILILALALAAGLYFGLSSNKPQVDSPDCDNFCCDPSEVPIGHLAPVSCYCFGTTNLVHEDDNGDEHKDAFRQEYFDQAKKHFMEFLKREQEAMGNHSNSFVTVAIQELEPMQGNTCHLYDQMLLMFSNNVTFQTYLNNKRASLRNSHLMLASLFIATNGVNWTVNEGWFDAEPDYDEMDSGDVGFDLCRWFGLECLFANHVSYLNLRENNLNGTLPSDLFMFSRLQELDVSGNSYLTGKLPAAIGNLVELTSLSIAGTGMYGTIPAELANIQQLHELYLGGGDEPCSGFHGEIPPILFDNPFLRRVYINLNGLQTSLPSEVGLASNLQTLNLFAAGLTGKIPTDIAKLSRLKVLDLSYNHLDSGTIPSEFALDLELVYMNLAYSGLNETIPESFCETVNSTRGKLLVASNCDYPMCSCCRNITDGILTSIGDYMIDVTCVQTNDDWEADFTSCSDDDSMHGDG